MMINSYPLGPIETNLHVITCELSREAAIIDAPEGALEVLKTLENFNPKFLLLTHTHWDHIGDMNVISEHFDIPVYVHGRELDNAVNPGSDRVGPPLGIPGVDAPKELNEGDCLRIGELECIVIHTPGHSKGGVCFHFEKEGVLLAGDTLFQGSMGRIDLPTSEPKKMWMSLKKLTKLPKNTRVYCGHGPDTTIGQEVEYGVLGKLMEED